MTMTTPTLSPREGTPDEFDDSPPNSPPPSLFAKTQEKVHQGHMKIVERDHAPFFLLKSRLSSSGEGSSAGSAPTDIYRDSSVGVALQKVLLEMMEEGKIGKLFAEKAMLKFDARMESELKKVNVDGTLLFGMAEAVTERDLFVEAILGVEGEANLTSAEAARDSVQLHSDRIVVRAQPTAEERRRALVDPFKLKPRPFTLNPVLEDEINAEVSTEDEEEVKEDKDKENEKNDNK